MILREFLSYQNIRGEFFPFTPYATVYMLCEIVVHHSFFVKSYGCVC